MTRDIIEIDEERCDGCGDCVIGCSEGAIQIVNGKAKLVREDFCDGFGDCVRVCPTGALTVTRREAPDFDEAATRAHLHATGGAEAVRRFEQAQQRHEAEHPAPSGCPGSAQRVLGGTAAQMPVIPLDIPARPAASHAPHGGGCPGSAARMLRQEAPPAARPQAPAAAVPSPAIIPSELGQWPVQLHLVQPGAPFFRNRELVLLNSCGAVASAEVHQRYLRGRGVAMACPKLDTTEPYARKLGAILQDTSIPKLVIVIMEVPCCRGLVQIAAQALEISGREDLVVEEHVLSLEGNVKGVRVLAGA